MSDYGDVIMLTANASQSVGYFLCPFCHRRARKIKRFSAVTVKEEVINGY